MQCREFEDRLNLLLDERRQSPAADQLLAAHAEGCEACAQLLAGHEALLAGLAHWKRRPVPRTAGDFSRRVVAQVRADEVARPSPRAWLVAVGLVATAAAVLLAVSIAAWNSVGSSRVAQHAPIAPQGADGALAIHKPAPPATRGSRGGSGPLLLFARPGVYREAIADVASTLPDAVERLDQVERYAPGIRPIRISFTMLLEALWRTIPGMDADQPADDNARLTLRSAAGLV